jgi:mRNA interferase RelE/StbE
MMPKWNVVFSDFALKSLKKMDPPTAALILGFIEKKLQNCEDPRALGKPLLADHRGKWRYRIGDYRILCLIDDNKITIVVIEVGHRRAVHQ